MSFRSAASRSPDRPSMLRNRDFVVSTLARAVSAFGDQLAVIVLVLRLHNLHGGGWDVAAVLAAGALPGVLFSPFAGLLADRWDSRGLLLAGSLVQFLVCTLLAFSGRVAVVLGLVGVLSAVEAVTSATWQALVPRIVGEDHIAPALGLGRTSTTAASLVAPVAGGVLAAAFGSRLPLLIDAGTYLVVLGAAIIVRTRRRIVGDGRTRSRMREGLVFARSDRLARPLLTSLIVFVLLGGTVNVVDVFLVRDTLDASDSWYGAIVALWLAGVVAGSLLAGRLRGELALTRAALGGAATIAIALGAIAAVPSVGWLVPFEVTGGIGNGMLMVAVGALLLARTPETLRGRVSATVNGVANAAMLGALALGGALAAALSPRTIFVIAATAAALCVATSALALRTKASLAG